tara:strand:+ start:550 stop:945 length:396 start_codon:yes stop_codon:yes gene_type:complete
MQSDRSLGIQAEIQLLGTIQEHFGKDLKPTGTYAKFDFENETTLVELKTRRCTSNAYPDTMIPYGKIKFLRDSNKEGVFVFNFTDGIFYHRFVKGNTYTVKQGGRYDRGRPELNQYCYINRSDLLPISKKL